MWKSIILASILMLISGLADSYGFIHAAKIWQDGTFVRKELFYSAGGYLLGILAFWISVRPMSSIGYSTAGLLTLIWFTVAIVGVGILTGEFTNWDFHSKIAAITTILSLAFLLYKQG